MTTQNAICTRIDTRFSELRRAHQKGFIAYISAGDPNLRATVDQVLRLEDAGVDIIELGIPFSDPLADGKVNQLAATRALEAGTTVDGVFDTVAKIREQSNIPIMFYTYLNLLIARDFNKTARSMARVGADGVLVLDLPEEELTPYKEVLDVNGINNVCLITPTTPERRIRQIVKSASGFAYCVSREGVTGMQDRIAPQAIQLIKTTKRLTKLPVALGFGISTPEHARVAASAADAIVVGSAIVNRFHQSAHTAKGRAAAAKWVGTLVRAVKEL